MIPIAMMGETPPKAVVILGKPVITLKSKMTAKRIAVWMTNLITARETMTSIIINNANAPKKNISE